MDLAGSKFASLRKNDKEFYNIAINELNNKKADVYIFDELRDDEFFTK